ncbi:MAG: SCP2 sterol-binding domain-containing protein [Zoogloeaceae bacterium]|jgi:predicted lipid carrier protein YhbT|nr:SCP2 sterol-binding domain-containing protein [Zoogloeaceae bacterium]
MSFTLPAIPEFHLPGLFRRLNRRLPQWPHAIPLCVVLNGAARLGVLPTDAAELCEGRIVRIAVEDGGTEALLTCRNGTFYPVWHQEEGQEADVSFRGELHAYLKLLTRQEDPDTLFFNRQLTIEGDTELGLAIKNLLDAIDWPPPVLERFRARFSPQKTSMTV